jgi:hypothetical protein
VLVDFERQLVLDPWVDRVALVVVGDRFAGVSEENSVPISRSSLCCADGEALFLHRVWNAGALDLRWSGAGVLGVVGVDLDPKHRPFETAAGFARIVRAESGGKHGVWQEQRACRVVCQTGLSEVLGGEVVGYSVSPEEDAGVEPGLGVHGWNV